MKTKIRYVLVVFLAVLTLTIGTGIIAVQTNKIPSTDYPNLNLAAILNQNQAPTTSNSMSTTTPNSMLNPQDTTTNPDPLNNLNPDQTTTTSITTTFTTKEGVNAQINEDFRNWMLSSTENMLSSFNANNETITELFTRFLSENPRDLALFNQYNKLLGDEINANLSQISKKNNYEMNLIISEGKVVNEWNTTTTVNGTTCIQVVQDYALDINGTTQHTLKVSLYDLNGTLISDPLIKIDIMWLWMYIGWPFNWWIFEGYAFYCFVRFLGSEAPAYIENVKATFFDCSVSAYLNLKKIADVCDPLDMALGALDGAIEAGKIILHGVKLASLAVTALFEAVAFVALELLKEHFNEKAVEASLDAIEVSNRIDEAWEFNQEHNETFGFELCSVIQIITWPLVGPLCSYKWDYIMRCDNVAIPICPTMCGWPLMNAYTCNVILWFMCWWCFNFGFGNWVDCGSPAEIYAEFDSPYGNNNGWYKSSVTVTLKTVFPEDVTMQWRLNDDEDWNTYTVPFPIPDSEEGVNILHYRSIDDDGKIFESHETVCIDNSAPVTTSTAKSSLTGRPGIYDGTTNSWLLNSDTLVTLTPTDRYSLPAVTDYRLDGTTNWLTYNGPILISNEGITTIYYNSTDNAGNTETTKSVTVIIDKTAPVTEIYSLDGPKSDGVYTGSVTATLTWIDPESNGYYSGVSSTQYSYNGYTWNNYNDPLIIEGGGTIILYYRSIDKAGNVENTKSVPIVKTMTNISISGTLGSNGWYTSDVSVILTATNNYSAVSEIDYSLNDTNNWINGTVPADVSCTVVYSIVTSSGQSYQFSYSGALVVNEGPVTYTGSYDPYGGYLGQKPLVFQGGSITYDGFCDYSWWSPIIYLCPVTYTGEVIYCGGPVIYLAPVTYQNKSDPQSPPAFVDYGHSYYGPGLVVYGGAVTYQCTANYGAGGPVIYKGPVTYQFRCNYFYGTCVYMSSVTYIQIGEPYIYRTSFVYPGSVVEQTESIIHYPATYNVSFSVSAEGVTTLCYTAVNGLGGVDPTSTATIMVDKTPPVTSFSSSGTPGRNWWYTSDVVVTLTPTYGASGLAGTWYSVGGTNWLPYTGPFTISDEGYINIYYYSANNAGKVENTKTEQVRIDKNPPVNIIGLNGTQGLNGWYTSDVAVTCRATDSASGISWMCGAGSYTISTEGNWTLYFESNDFAGNHKLSTPIVMVDKTAPVTTISLSGTQGLNGWYTSDVTVTLTTTDSVSGAAMLAYSFDGVNWFVYNGSLTVSNAMSIYWPFLTPTDQTSGTNPFTISITISSEGSTILYFQSIDFAGNIENQNISLIMVDKAPPATSIGLNGVQGSNGAYTSDVIVNLTATDTAAAASGILNLNYILSNATADTSSATNSTGVPIVTMYKLDGGSWTTYNGTPFTISTDGTHTLTYYSTDNAGNVENTHSVTITVQRFTIVTSISLSGQQGLNGWYTSNVNVTLKVTDKKSSTWTTTYRLNATGSWNTYTGPFTISAEGITTIYYNSTDKLGNKETTNNITVKIDKTPPATAINPNGTTGSNGWYTSNVTITLTTTDTTSGVWLTGYRLDNNIWMPYTGPFNITVEGIHTLVYASIDNAGNYKISSTVTVMIDKTLPATSISSLNGTRGLNGWYTSDVAVTLTATYGVSGLAMTVYNINGTGWTTYTGSFTISAEGVTTLYYYSTDNAGNVETAHNVTVMIDKTPPATSLIIFPKPNTFLIGSATFMFSATDNVSGVAYTCYRINGGDWIWCNNFGGFVGLKGTYTIDYYSVDSAGNQEPLNSRQFYI